MKSNLVGGGNNRNDFDFYSTPSWVTEALFEREKFEGKVWECASGSGFLILEVGMMFMGKKDLIF